MRKKKDPKISVPPRKISRRQVLMLGGGIGALVLGKYFLGNHASEPTHERESYVYALPDAGSEEGSLPASKELKFDFLRRGEEGTLENILRGKDWRTRSQLISSFDSALPYPETLAQINIQIANELPQLGQRYKTDVHKIGFEIGTNSRQHCYLIPEPDPEFAQQYRAYCQFATSFLYSQPELQILPKPVIEWKLPSDEKVKSDAIPAHVGLAFVLEERVLVTFKMPPNVQEPVAAIFSAFPKIGAGHLLGWGVETDEKDQVVGFLNGPHQILVGTYASPTEVLQAPFSEMIHLLFEEGANKYILGEKKKVNDQQELRRRGTKFSETSAESVAMELTRRIIRHLNNKGVSFPTPYNDLLAELERAGQNETNIPGAYQDFPKAYRYIQRYGLRRTVNLVMNDPSRYMREIQKP